MVLLSQGEAIPDKMHKTLYELILQGNSVYALDSEQPECMTNNTFFIKEESPPDVKQYVHDKGILILSFADKQAVEHVSAKISSNPKSLLVNVPTFER